MKNTITVEFDAPPSRIFQWLYDSDRLLLWLPNLVENEVLTHVEGAPGSTFRQVYLEHGRRMEMLGTVTAYEADRHLGCTMTGDAFDLMVDYRLEDLGARTRLTQHSEVSFKGMAMRLIGTLLKPMMRKMSAKQSAAAFGKLKECVEADMSLA